MTRFDQSLIEFSLAVLDVLGMDRLQAGLILRDSTGRLSFIAGEDLDSQLTNSLNTRLTSSMGGYVRKDGRAFFNRSWPGANLFWDDDRIFRDSIQLDSGEELHIRCLDRRIVGKDWLVAPVSSWAAPQPARLVFASMKGGVGRSTALAVLATDLAASGLNVLALDLDLEAPGIGSMLIPEEHKPKFGALDYYVESSISGVDSEFIEDMVSPSPFSSGHGLIDVVPAVGKLADQYPGNVLAKLARAYLEETDEDGTQISFLGHTQKMVEQLAIRRRYDAILIDARAGLNEITAAPILGLGADVLLFGVNTPQTFASYRFLLAHLARFSRNTDDDWLLRLKMVHSKASPEDSEQKGFRDRAFGMFKSLLYRDKLLLESGQVQDAQATSTIEEFTIDDESAPHFAWPILTDANFAFFDPLSDAKLLSDVFYRRTFDKFLTGTRERLGF